MALDKETRREIAQAVSDAVRYAVEGVNEKWINGKELCEQFSMFTPTWLKSYGYMLPRTQATVLDGEKRTHTNWAYPRNRIQRMIAEGKLDFVVGESVIYK